MFISAEKVIESVLIAFMYSALLCGCCFKLLGIIQACGYNGRRFLKWANRRGNYAAAREILLAMLCALAYAVIALSFSFAGHWAAVVGTAAYIALFALYIFADNRIALRIPASPTPRFKRLFAALFILIFIVVYFAVTLLNYASYRYAIDYPNYSGVRIFDIFRFCPLAVLPLLMMPFVLVANFFTKFYEIPHNKKFVKKAKEKMSGANITVIGITGSYGKTGTKVILTEILKKKYRVLSTPRSFNTPMGLSLCVNDNDLSEYDVLIAEMGARHVGDIKELCAICQPDYSIITGICPQHLESFGSVGNIVKAKGEILESTKKEAFIAQSCFETFADYSCQKTAGGNIYDVICTPEGTSFSVELGGKQVKLKTKLLGRHSAENIALAATAAFALGMSEEEIAEAVSGLDYIEHRLQLIKSGGVNILDDGYNSNVKGAAAALDVLKSFEGRKIVVTPGLVELGVLEAKENKMLGAKLVGFDLVILVGETLIAPVKQGYLENGGDEQKLVFKPTLILAQEVLKSYLQDGDTVLFLNDLPDIY